MERKISSKPVDVSRLSPMMRQYWKVKEQYLEQLLFFRLGDFYELFFDDALIASRELELTLTGKECGLDERAPMCGIPYHSCENYIARLVKKGYKVAICEQMEDPATAKGLVKREIIRVITPGTVLESNMLDAGSNNYLCLIFRHPQQECFGVVFSDVSTGEVYALQVDSDWEKRVIGELGRFSPAEVLLNLPAGSCEPLQKFLNDRLQVTGEILDEEYFDWERCRKLSADQFGSEEIAQLESSGQQSVIFALGAMIHYLTQTQKHGLESLTHLEIYSDEQYMTLDLTARRNLELTRTLRSGERRGTLLWVLDQTKTPMGKRLIRSVLEKPLLNPTAINKRLNAVGELLGDSVRLDNIRQELRDIFDMERLITRIVYGLVTPREMRSLQFTAQKLPQLKQTVGEVQSVYLTRLLDGMDTLEDISSMIECAISDDPPALLKDGGVIRTGYNEELDSLREIVHNTKGVLTALESREREKTGIKNLKVGFNNVFGYYIEVTRSFLSQVPPEYVRKQTLTGSERYITQELKELEQQILGAKDRILVLENNLFDHARNSGWVAGTDYTIDYQVTTADGVKRTATLGSGTVYGNLRTTGIFVETDTVTVNLIPSEAHTANYNVGTKTVVTKVGGGAQSFAISVPKAYTVKVTAPAGSTVSVGTFGNYYTYEFLRPLEDSTAAKDGDTVTVTYRVPETSLNHFVRVQNPDGVTYWDFNKWTTDQDIVVTRDDLHMDDDFNKDTVSRFDKNTYDLGNVYLNINSKGYMNMNAGDTYELDVFRNWQAIEGFMNAKIALPDAHYEVVDFDGKPSDVVSIAPNADNSCLAYMTANHQGTALVKVTYDAMTHKQGQSSTADKTFSAIWPEFTGVFVVSVGADGTAIQTNMLMDRMDAAVTKDEQKQLDAEHDILFYLDTDGASYTFTPESGCTVTVARSTVGKTMTFNGFTSQGVTVDAETGAVTVANLTTGRHIVRVEKDGVATYQVITARGVSYKLLDAEGKELPENAEVKPGETVQLQFTGLVSPKEKMSGVYNHNFSLYYTDADGNFFQSNPGGGFGVYDFSGNPARQRISITVPADQKGLTYELTGAIKVGGFGGKPTHRIVTYAQGMGMQYGTSTANVLAQLPQVTLKLSGYAADGVEKLIDAIGTVTLDSEEAIKAARGAYDALTDAQKELVGNYQTLLDAEAKLAQLKKDAEKPSQPEQPAKPGEDANKPATGDAGVTLWLTVMCMTSLLGAALVGKKRKA